jgi:two-component system NtrC family sensor kinase
MELVDFETNFADDPELVCYPAQLNQVFMNLVVNAVEAIQIKQRQQTDNTVTKNKGLIVESDLGVGSEFVLRLPV